MLKQKTYDKKHAKAKNADLIDWVLAIDSCLT